MLNFLIKLNGIHFSHFNQFAASVEKHIKILVTVAKNVSKRLVNNAVDSGTQKGIVGQRKFVSYFKSEIVS